MNKFIPLTQAQNVCLTYASVAPPSMLNLCIRVNILEEIDEALFKEALNITVERLPYCRYRIGKNQDGSVYQYESPMDQQKTYESYDFSNYTESKLEQVLSGWASEPYPNGALDTQLYRFRLIHLKDGKSCLFICMHHIISDIYAVSFAGMYIAKVYDALKNGSELPSAGADPETVVNKQIAFDTSERVEIDKQWIIQTYNDEPQFTSINGCGGKEHVKGKRYGHDRGITQMRAEEYQYCIPKELSDAINQQAMEHNFSPYIYYIAALRTYLAKVNKTDDVMFDSMVADRSKLSEKNSGLVRDVVIAFRTKNTDEISFADLLSELQLLHQEYLRHRSIAAVRTFVHKMYDVPKGMVYSSIMFSYVPFIDFSKIPLKITASKVDSGISICPLYILIVPTDDSGNLSVFYQISKGYIKPESVEKFHAFMLKFLKTGLTHPNSTIKELVDESI